MTGDAAPPARAAFGRRAVAWGALVVALASPVESSAQESSARSPREGDEPARLDPATPLTLRPTSDTRGLAERVVRALALRVDVPVAVGDDAPPQVLEAIPAGHVGVGRDGEEVQLVFAAPEGQVYRSRVRVDGDGAEAARAVALAVEALRDAALDGPPPGSEERRSFTLSDGRTVEWTYVAPEGGLFGSRPSGDAVATPLIALGLVLGVSTERLTAIVGPRLTVGLCLGIACVSLEGDVPALPDEREACDGRQIQYRAVNLGMAVTLRPLVVDDTSFALHLGLLTRFGIAELVDVDVSRVVSDFGLRAGVEVAWRFIGDFEGFLAVGFDANTEPARFERQPRPAPDTFCPPSEVILVEDLVTVWSVLGVRLRPL